MYRVTECYFLIEFYVLLSLSLLRTVYSRASIKPSSLSLYCYPAELVVSINFYKGLMYHLVMNRVQTLGLFPIWAMLAEVCFSWVEFVYGWGDGAKNNSTPLLWRFECEGEKQRIEKERQTQIGGKLLLSLSCPMVGVYICTSGNHYNSRMRQVGSYTTYPLSHLCTHAHKCACVHRNTHPHTHTRIHCTYTTTTLLCFTLIPPRTSPMGNIIMIFITHLLTNVTMRISILISYLMVTMIFIIRFIMNAAIIILIPYNHEYLVLYSCGHIFYHTSFYECNHKYLDIFS